MTDEHEARERLLAHYESRLLMLAGKLERVEAEIVADCGQTRVATLQIQAQRYRRDVTDTREKARRLQAAMAQT